MSGRQLQRMYAETNQMKFQRKIYLHWQHRLLYQHHAGLLLGIQCKIEPLKHIVTEPAESPVPSCKDVGVNTDLTLVMLDSMEEELKKEEINSSRKGV